MRKNRKGEEKKYVGQKIENPVNTAVVVKVDKPINKKVVVSDYTNTDTLDDMSLYVNYAPGPGGSNTKKRVRNEGFVSRKEIKRENDVLWDFDDSKMKEDVKIQNEVINIDDESDWVIKESALVDIGKYLKGFFSNGTEIGVELEGINKTIQEIIKESNSTITTYKKTGKPLIFIRVVEAAMKPYDIVETKYDYTIKTVLLYHTIRILDKKNTVEYLRKFKNVFIEKNIINTTQTTDPNNPIFYSDIDEIIEKSAMLIETATNDGTVLQSYKFVNVDDNFIKFIFDVLKRFMNDENQSINKIFGHYVDEKNESYIRGDRDISPNFLANLVDKSVIIALNTFNMDYRTKKTNNIEMMYPNVKYLNTYKDVKNMDMAPYSILIDVLSFYDGKIDSTIEPTVIEAANATDNVDNAKNMTIFLNMFNIKNTNTIENSALIDRFKKNPTLHTEFIVKLKTEITERTKSTKTLIGVYNNMVSTFKKLTDTNKKKLGVLGKVEAYEKDVIIFNDCLIRNNEYSYAFILDSVERRSIVEKAIFFLIDRLKSSVNGTDTISIDDDYTEKLKRLASDYKIVSDILKDLPQSYQLKNKYVFANKKFWNYIEDVAISDLLIGVTHIKLLDAIIAIQSYNSVFNMKINKMAIKMIAIDTAKTSSSKDITERVEKTTIKNVGEDNKKMEALMGSLSEMTIEEKKPTPKPVVDTVTKIITTESGLEKPNIPLIDLTGEKTDVTSDQRKIMVSIKSEKIENQNIKIEPVSVTKSPVSRTDDIVPTTTRNTPKKKITENFSSGVVPVTTPKSQMTVQLVDTNIDDYMTGIILYTTTTNMFRLIEKFTKTGGTKITMDTSAFIKHIEEIFYDKLITGGVPNERTTIGAIKIDESQTKTLIDYITRGGIKIASILFDLLMLRLNSIKKPISKNHLYALKLYVFELRKGVDNVSYIQNRDVYTYNDVEYSFDIKKDDVDTLKDIVRSDIKNNGGAVLMKIFEKYNAGSGMSYIDFKNTMDIISNIVSTVNKYRNVTEIKNLRKYIKEILVLVYEEKDSELIGNILKIK
jgi:hypothetical protein